MFFGVAQRALSNPHSPGTPVPNFTPFIAICQTRVLTEDYISGDLFLLQAMFLFRRAATGPRVWIAGRFLFAAGDRNVVGIEGGTVTGGTGREYEHALWRRGQ